MTTETRMLDAFEDKGAGYATFKESQAIKSMTNAQAESVVKTLTGIDYTLLTVNNSTDSRKASPDARVYTFLLTSTYVKQQAKRLKKQQS